MYYIYTDIHKIYVLYPNTKEIGNCNLSGKHYPSTKLTHLSMWLEIQFQSLSVLKNTHGER